MPLVVRPFRPDEAETLKALRLEALADTPEAFAERHDVAVAAGGEDFSAPLAAGTIWGAFRDGQAIAMAGFERYRGTNVAHKATIWGVYVSPRARGTGAGKALFQAIIDHAPTVGVEILHLGVGDFNAPAQALYRRMGFLPIGQERRAVKLGDIYVDETLMSLHL